MRSRPALVRVLGRAHRATLRLLPGGFREHYGEEIRDALAHVVDERLRERGATAAAALLLREIGNVIALAMAQRRRLGASRPHGAGIERGSEVGMMETFVRDVLVALRMFRGRPLFFLVAVSTLALGIGANTAIFSVVNGVLIRPVPFPDDEQLVRVYHVDEESGSRRGSFSVPDRDALAERSTSLRSLGVYSTLPSGPLMTGGTEAVELAAAYVSPGFFDALGRSALIGRTLLDEESEADNRVVVLSHGFWLTRFGGDESVVGRDIQLDDQAFRVVGVMPPDFVFPERGVEAWLFLSVIPPESIPLHVRQVRFLEAVGRLQPGVSTAQAESELAAVATALAAEYPNDNGDIRAEALVPLRESMTADVSTTLIVLLAAVGMVLLIACANVANLLFGRSLERRKELTVRRALGAGRGRLVRQLMTESLLLSLFGGLVGALLAFGGVRMLLRFSPDLLPRVDEIALDPLVLAFALAATGGTAIACGLAPALRVTRDDADASLRSGGRGSVGGVGRTEGLIVAAQVGLAVLVVTGSGLLVRSLIALERVDSGLDVDALVALTVNINDARYPDRPAYLGLYESLMTEIARLPDVSSVGSIRSLPLHGGGESVGFEFADAAGSTESGRLDARLLQVSPGFFETAGVPLLEGREFTSLDRADAPQVVVVNDAFRRRFLPDRSPVGFGVDDVLPDRAEIVGVVGDVHQDGLAEDPEPTIYVPQAQNPRRGMTFLIRTADPAAAIPSVRAAVRAVDPDQPIEELAVMSDVVRTSASRPRFFSALLGSFGVLALLLAAFGIYGVVSHSVSRRTSEIGLRVALGATEGGVVGLVLSSGMRPVLVGAVVGVVASLFGTEALSTLLFGVGARDPVTLFGVPLLMLAVAVVACVVPARRALAVDPTEALRTE